jgi:hypothetical protein
VLAELVDLNGQVSFHFFTERGFTDARRRRRLLVGDAPAHEQVGPLPADIQQRIGPRRRTFKDTLREAGLLPPEPPQSSS